MYSDLESDYINPIDLCTKLNQFTLPEMCAHGFLTVLFLLNGQWIALAINLPLLAYNVHKYVSLMSASGRVSLHSRACTLQVLWYWLAQIHEQDISAGCNRDLPYPDDPQKRKLPQIRVLSPDFLLLLVPVRIHKQNSAWAHNWCILTAWSWHSSLVCSACVYAQHRKTYANSRTNFPEE